MSQAIQAAKPVALSPARPCDRPMWRSGLYAAASWAAAVIVTKALPDVIPFGSSDLFAVLVGAGAAAFAVLAFLSPRAGRFRGNLPYFFPPFLAPPAGAGSL